jgi:hypothetical protein
MRGTCEEARDDEVVVGGGASGTKASPFSRSKSKGLSKEEVRGGN